MTKLSLIAACAANRVMGREGRLPWRIPEDLAWFDEWTRGKPVLLGRLCYESWPQAHQAGRRPIVISSQPLEALRLPVIPPGGFAPRLVRGVEEALQEAALLPGETLVCGGARIFEACLPLASRLYLTEVHAEVPGDVLFPEWRHLGWTCRHRYSSSNFHYRYTFSILERNPAPGG